MSLACLPRISDPEKNGGIATGEFHYGETRNRSSLEETKTTDEIQKISITLDRVRN